MNKKFYLPKEIFLLKVFSWTRKMQFEQTCSIIFAKVLKKVVRKSKSGQEKHILYFKVVVFSGNVPLDNQIAVLASLPKLFPQKSEMFCSKSEKQKKCCFFLRKKSFLQTFRWTLGMHFWQPSQNVLPKVRIFFDENEKKLFSLNMFPWTPILHFWQACQKNSAKTWKSSCRKSRILLKRFFFRKKNHQDFPL